MSAFDVESLLREVSPGARCGGDISQDSEFLELEAMVRPKPPGAVQTAEDAQIVEPNWAEIRQRAFDLLRKAKHLQVAVYFSLALLTTEGMAGLRDGLCLIHGLLEQFWDELYPRLDPDDDNDPTERMNILMPLSVEPASQWDPVRFRSRLLRLPLCSSRRTGGFSLRDIQMALAEKTTPDSGHGTPQMSIIQAAFHETPPDELEALLLAARQAVAHLDGIRSVFEKQAQGGSAPDVSGLRDDLQRICRTLEQYTRTGPAANDLTQSDPTIRSAGERGPSSTTSEIRSRNEALAAIEQACRYFECHEPSSPVPLLLRRAQRLAPKTFLEIIEDVCPSAMAQVVAVGGTVGSGSEGGGAGAGQA
ncbi:MAG: type VI secretion system protein TssA [Phycisphaerales bacterium]